MLTILKDDEIAQALNTLTLDELEGFRGVLKNALFEYSTGTQVTAGGKGSKAVAGTSEIQQPARTSVTSPVTGAKTLFQPACSADGIGMKVLTVPATKTTTTSTTMTAAADEEEEVAAASAAGPTHPRPTGALTLFSSTGRPIGILHAGTLTAFRTALASACLLLRRESVRNVTVFGCGEQAYWHVRLALLLRGTSIRHVNIITRRFDAGQAFLARLHQLPADLKAREGWASGSDKSATKFGILTTGYNDYGRLLRDHLRSADVIFCCTPATEPLFDAGILTSHEGRRKGRLIVAVGSSTQQMCELPADLLRQATNLNKKESVDDGSGGGGGRSTSISNSTSSIHYHKHAVEGGVIVVDTLDGALKEAGEIVEAGLTPRHLVELGELVMLSRIALNDDDMADDTLPLSTTTTVASAGSGATTPGSPTSPLSSPPLQTASLDKLTLSGPAMASVFGGGDATRSPSVSTPTIVTSAHPEDTLPDHRKSSSGPFSSFFGGGSRSSSPARKHGHGHSRSHSGSVDHSRVASPTRKSSGGGVGSGLLANLAPRSHHHHHHHRRSSSTASVEHRKKKEDHSARWLQRGNVIYKSVGLGLMDLCVGLHLVAFAQEKGIGTRVEGF